MTAAVLLTIELLSAISLSLTAILNLNTGYFLILSDLINSKIIRYAGFPIPHTKVYLKTILAEKFKNST